DGTYTGHGSDLGDVNGDGIADATIGAYNTNGGKGTIFVVYGPLDAGTSDLADADGTHDASVTGGYCGRVVRSGYDMTGDGIGEIDLDDGDGVIDGRGANAGFGMNIDAKDIDGDGRTELLVGSPGAQEGTVSGAVYLFYTPIEGALDTGDAGAVWIGEH